MSELIGWVGTAFLLVATWYMSPRRRWPFLVTVVGEVIWIVASLMKQSPAMTFVCVVFGILAIRNYRKWNHG